MDAKELRVGEEALGSLKRGHLWAVTASGVIGSLDSDLRTFPHEF